jgi:SAM-dependent methyltransferase
MTEVPFSDRYTPTVMQENHITAIQSAEKIVPLLLDEFPTIKSVLDVGCGLGTWLAAFQRRGIEDILGIDGPWTPVDQLVIPAQCFLPVDLREINFLELRSPFDIVICLEIIEHLPDENATDLITFLTTMSPVIFFSAAYPGQGGHFHVNEQPREYWLSKFATRGFFPRELPGLKDITDANFWYTNAFLLEAARWLP